MNTFVSARRLQADMSTSPLIVRGQRGLPPIGVAAHGDHVGNGSGRGSDIAHIERHGMSSAVSTKQTSELRKELEVAGVPLPTDHQLMALSVKFDAWICAYREAARQPASSWCNLFTTLDRDGSGVISFDEWIYVVRHELKKPAGAISDDELKALFVALDANEDSELHRDEMSGLYDSHAEARTQRSSIYSSKTYPHPASGNSGLCIAFTTLLDLYYAVTHDSSSAA